MLANQALNYLVSGKPPTRMGNAHPNLVPYQVFPVADGHIVIATGNDSQYRKLCDVLGVPHLAEHSDFVSNASRIANRHRLVDLLSERTSTFTRADLLAALERVGVPAGPINGVADVFADPQAMHRGLRIDLPAPTPAGTVPSVRGPLVLDGEPLVAGSASPRLGEHTQEVLEDPAWGGRG